MAKKAVRFPRSLFAEIRREAERANMRRLVKRLLKKYNYPPEEADGAMNIVMEQCEQWADNQDIA